LKKIFSAILFYFVLLPLSWLPYSVIYFISNGIAFVLENVVSYRKDVIMSNLRASFPEKSEKEIAQIAKAFYQHLSDVLFETLKSLSWSKEDAQARVKYENLEDINRFFNEGKDVLLLLGHFGNWEWFGPSFPMAVPHKAIGIYKPLSNTFFDEKIKQTRGKYGLELVPMKDTNDRMKEQGAKPKMAMFLTDQSPSNPNRCYWTTFLNQETGVQFGAEKFAKVYDMPLVYMSISKPKRGFYIIKFKTLFENPQETEVGEITVAHTLALETDIIKNPELWLWSHKRWKHKKPVSL